VSADAPQGYTVLKKALSNFQPPIQSPTPNLQRPTFKPRQLAGGFLALGNWELELVSLRFSAALLIAALRKQGPRGRDVG
jgi:hypothetical protein